MDSLPLLLFLTFLSFQGSHGKSFLPHVVGGVPASPGEFPYQVSLQAQGSGGSDEWFPFCGGIIISPTTFLSAAHCILFNQGDYGALRIVAGQTDLEEDSDSRQIRLVALDKIYTHPEWDSFNYLNDIGLFTLEEPLEFNKFVNSVSLPPAGHISQGFGVVTGWGSIVEGGPNVPALQKASIEIFSADECSSWYGDDFKEHMLCAGTFDGSIDACAGDSGGPLVANDLDQPYVAGVVSWGVGCGREGYLGFYTKVSDFIDWINDPASFTVE